MNANQAKQIRMVDVMERLGFDVKKTERGSREHKYLSPFRSEAEPSFNVNLDKNSWFDFGASEGGNTLDFAIQYLRSQGKPGRVSDALFWLESLMGRPSQPGRVGEPSPAQQEFFSFSPGIRTRPAEQPSPETAADRDLELVKVSPLKAASIFSYLESRRIPPELAQLYLVLVHYLNKKKPSQRPYFAIGLPNRSGGYEIRSCSDDPKLKFKSSILSRDITVIPGREQGRGVANLFEGMFDYLSLLVMLKTDRLTGDAIILNGLSSYGLAKSFIEEQGYTTLNSFLDNNPAGQDKTAELIRDFGEKVINHSPRFLPHVDLNDALRAGDIPTFAAAANPPQP